MSRIFKHKWDNDAVSQATSYFVKQSENTFMPTEHVSGGWNVAEQHVAPPMGLIVHLLETDHAARGGNLSLLSVNYDILGVIPLEAITVEIKVLRPGRTIELVEATLSNNGRVALIARAWFLAESDTSAIAGSMLEPIASRLDTPQWRPSIRWPGGFIASLEAHQREEAPGRAQTWARMRYPLLDSEPNSITAGVLGTVDLANGTTPRADPRKVLFPNLDLKVSMLRKPTSDWLGLDTRVTFESNGFGMTHSVMHDDLGPFATAVQALTVRPL